MQGCAGNNKKNARYNKKFKKTQKIDVLFRVLCFYSNELNILFIIIQPGLNITINTEIQCR